MNPEREKSRVHIADGLTTGEAKQQQQQGENQKSLSRQGEEEETTKRTRIIKWTYPSYDHLPTVPAAAAGAPIQTSTGYEDDDDDDDHHRSFLDRGPRETIHHRDHHLRRHSEMNHGRW